jgi:site-specific recombinase XerD
MGEKAGIADVRPRHVRNFLAGAGPITRTWRLKYDILRSFYGYAISRGYVARSPLPTVIPQRPPAFVPYIYSREELRRLFQLAGTMHRPQATLEPITLQTVLFLLYGAGLRLQEALNLNETDVDFGNSLLTIRETKFYKTRLVPIGAQIVAALAKYSRTRTRCTDASFFTMKRGSRVKKTTLQRCFSILRKKAGVLRTDGGRFQPRLHDLRHAFAVHRLTSWYQQGADVQRLLPQLSTYLGHAQIQDTQVYLTMTPELLLKAGRRFEQYAGQEGRHD